MFLTVILVLVALGGVALCIWGCNAPPNSTDPSEDTGGVGRVIFGGLLVVICGLGLFISSIVVTATGYTKMNDANSIYSKIGVIQAQRDQMVPLVRDELSAEQLEALMEATSTDSQAFQIIHASGVTDLLIERAGRIIALNQEIFNLRNEALDLELEVCSARNNPFVPRIPFAYPDCRVDWLDKLQAEPVVAS